MEVFLHIYNPLLLRFLRAYLDPHEDGYLADMQTVFGAAVCSLVTGACDLPSPTEPSKHTVRLYLPRSRHTDRLRGKHLVITPQAERSLHVLLQKLFDITFEAYCIEGKTAGRMVKDIIEDFITEYGLADIFQGDIETLKKKHYRYELTTLAELREKLRQKACYAARKARKRVA